MKKVFIISICTLILACNQPGKQAKKAIERKVEHSNKLNKKDTILNPIVDFQLLLENDELETAKKIVLKYGANYKDEYGRNFFSSSIRQSLEITSFVLDNGYTMNSHNQHQLFEETKSDTNLFSNLYIKHIKDKPTISSAVFHSCDVNLLKYYLESENPDISLCSYNLPHMADFHCSCIINHCENNSVEILNMLLDHSLSNLPQDNSCIIENWIQDYPKLADSLLVENLLKNNLIIESETWSPLISYCTWNQNNIVELLLQNGYSPNWNNSSDLLYYAATRVGDGFGEGLSKEKRNETVQLLLEYGANPELEIKVDFGSDDERINFIEFATKWKFEDNTELLRILKEYAK